MEGAHLTADELVLGADFFGRFRSGLGTGCVGMRFVHNSLLKKRDVRRYRWAEGGRLEHGAIYTISLRLSGTTDERALFRIRLHGLRKNCKGTRPISASPI